MIILLPATCIGIIVHPEKYKYSATVHIAAARVTTGARKFDRGLGQILHDQLHWLDVPDRVLFKLAVTVHQV